MRRVLCPRNRALPLASTTPRFHAFIRRGVSAPESGGCLNWNGLWELLHLVFAFSYVGSLTVAEWNSRAARATPSWAERARLFQIVHLSTRIAGLGSLFLAGVLGHVTAFGYGYRMGQDGWMMLVTVLWLGALAGMFSLNLPLSARLAETARLASEGSTGEGWASTLARWRFANVIQSVLYLVLLALMVFRWRS